APVLEVSVLLRFDSAHLLTPRTVSTIATPKTPNSKNVNSNRCHGGSDADAAICTIFAKMSKATAIRQIFAPQYWSKISTIPPIARSAPIVQPKTSHRKRTDQWKCCFHNLIVSALYTLLCVKGIIPHPCNGVCT